MGAFLDFRLKWQYQGKTGEIKAGEESLFHRAFMNLRHELVDWSPAFETIAEDVLTPLVEKQFETQGAAGGVTWAALAETTLSARSSGRRAQGILHTSNLAILQASGTLKRSFVEKGGDHVETITPKKLTWGSAVPYGLFHQTGTGKGFQRASGVPTGPGSGRGMAMRKILELTDATKKRMSRTMTGRIAQVARQIGFRIAGHEGIDPGEAARIGRIALGLKP